MKTFTSDSCRLWGLNNIFTAGNLQKGKLIQLLMSREAQVWFLDDHHCEQVWVLREGTLEEVCATSFLLECFVVEGKESLLEDLQIEKVR